MDMLLPGNVSDIDSIVPGSFILFSVGGELHAGLVVDNGNDGKAILDFEGADRQNKKWFMIYQGHHFAREAILNVSGARIVPDLAVDSLGHGQYGNSYESMALYLSQDGPIVHAIYERNGYKVNLQTGIIVQSDLAYLLHAKRWRIEVEDGPGKFKVLRNIEVAK